MELLRFDLPSTMTQSRASSIGEYIGRKPPASYSSGDIVTLVVCDATIGFESSSVHEQTTLLTLFFTWQPE